MVRKGLFDWLNTMKLDDFSRPSATSKDLSCMQGEGKVLKLPKSVATWLDMGRQSLVDFFN